MLHLLIILTMFSLQPAKSEIALKAKHDNIRASVRLLGVAAAGTVCDPGCSAGQCDPNGCDLGVCLPGHVDCANDVNNCGSVGNVCPSGGDLEVVCNNGSCAVYDPFLIFKGGKR